MSGQPLGPATIAFTEMVQRLTTSYLDAVSAAALELDIERNRQRTTEQGPNWLHGPVSTPGWSPKVESGHGPGQDRWMVRCTNCLAEGVYIKVIWSDAGSALHATEADAQETADRHAAWHKARGW